MQCALLQFTFNKYDPFIVTGQPIRYVYTSRCCKVTEKTQQHLNQQFSKTSLTISFGFVFTTLIVYLQVLDSIYPRIPQAYLVELNEICGKINSYHVQCSRCLKKKHVSRMYHSTSLWAQIIIHTHRALLFVYNSRTIQ